MRAASLLALLALVVPGASASALEAGDAITLTSNGVGLTVLSVQRPDPETVDLVAQRTKANAAAFCGDYKGLTPGSKKWDVCVSEHVSTGVHRIIVKCGAATILVTNDKGGSGSYRRPADGGPWVSEADPNTIIHVDDLFEAACRRPAP